MILKNGVTGFTAGDLSLERDYDSLVATFKKNCYKAVQHVKGQVLHWYDPEIDLCYAHAHVQVNHQKLYILYNASCDYIAFTTNRSITSLQFINHAELAQSFAEQYRVLTVAELEEPLRKQKKGDGHNLLNENTLNHVELYYMDYFPTEKVGDLVFNYWD